MISNLPEGWKTVKLEQLGEVVGGGTPSTKKSEYYDGGNIPWLTPKDLSGYRRRYISRGERNITEEGLANSSAKIYPAGTVLFSSRAPIGYVAIAKNEISTNQGFKSVIPYKDITTSDFIYYLLMHNTEKIKNMSSGSTFKEMSGTVMKNFIVNVPPYNEQVQIADVLSSFDDKIENNNAIIANLEAQAQAIFKSWFVDFEPFQDGEFVESELGEIPTGWEIGKLGNSSLGTLLKSGINNFEDEKIYLATADVTDSKIINYDTKITSDDKPSRANMQPTKNSVWFAKMKESRKLIYVGDTDDFLIDEVVFSTGFAGIQATELSVHFLWTYLLSEDFDTKKNLLSSGTTMQSINNTNINKIEIVVPEERVLKAFNDLVRPMFELISNYKYQNIKLAEGRDTLLPKLMSGEIRVREDDLKEIEI